MKIWLAAPWAVSGALMVLAPGCPPVLCLGFGGFYLRGLWVLWAGGLLRLKPQAGGHHSPPCCSEPPLHLLAGERLHAIYIPRLTGERSGGAGLIMKTLFSSDCL